MQSRIETIVVVVTRVIYRKDDSDWYILEVDKTKTAKGVVLFDVKEGDSLKLQGSWGISQFNGKEEFSFKTALLSMPTDARALLHYAVEITSGMAEAAEEKIWQEYKTKWKLFPKLEQITSISRGVKAKWQETLVKLDQYEEQTQAIAFLMSKGATLNLANHAWVRWKENTIKIVSEDCYRLAELPRYGFSAIDKKIREHFGIEDDDPRRASAAVLYLMGELSQANGTAVSQAALVDELHKLIPSLTGNDQQNTINNLVEDDKLVILKADQGLLALLDDYQNEVMIWERFK